MVQIVRSPPWFPDVVCPLTSADFGPAADNAQLMAGSCTSCGVKEDLSAYWTPALYFRYTNGTTALVETVGGMLVYYLLNGDNIKAFPPNFRMIAGDQYLRDFPWPVPDPEKSSWSGDQVSQLALSQKALGFNCLNYNKAPEPSLYRHTMPSKQFLDENCPDGLRLELMFPSCWDGKNTDSEDHKSHVAYPSLVNDGTCPEGFETRLPGLFFETIVNTYAFKDEEGEFIFSTGDPTGCGYHGDFIQGWDPDTLQQAVDTCTSLSGRVEDCSVFTLQGDDEASQCKFEVPDVLSSENILVNQEGLPGKVPIQRGPERASKYADELAKTWFVEGLAPATQSTPTPEFTAPVQPSIKAQVVDTTNIRLPFQAQAVDVAETSTPQPTPTTIEEEVVYNIVKVDKTYVVLCDDNGAPTTTLPPTFNTITTLTSTSTTTKTTMV